MQVVLCRGTWDGGLESAERDDDRYRLDIAL